jgi:hypothetical protein
MHRVGVVDADYLYFEPQSFCRNAYWMALLVMVCQYIGFGLLKQ